MSSSTIVIYGLMFAAFIGMLWANKQYKAKGVAWGRPLAAVLGIGSLVFAILAMIKSGGGTVDMDKVNEFRDRELAYQRISHKKLGEEIAKQHAGAKILLIKHKSSPMGDGGENLTEKAQMEGLLAGLNGEADIMVEEEVSSGMEDMMMGGDPDAPEKTPEEMMEDMLSAEKFNKLLAVNKTCNVVVSLAGLPPDYQLMKIWKIKDPKKRPALVVANAYLYDLKFAFNPKFKFITAALAHKAVAFDPNQPVPEDEQVAFDSRFIMITPENVVKVASDNADLFKSK